MPTYSYYGQQVTIDYLYAYSRVSSPQQLLEHGGEGVGRQYDLAQAFAQEFGVPLDADASMTDLGKSGSKGKHLADGALAGFMAAIEQRKLKGQHPGLIVESFSRLSRLPIDLALQLFLAIIGQGGVTLITLVDRRVYTQASVRRDQGQIYQVSAAMQAARAQAESIGYYSQQAWARQRRGSASNVIPSWIMKTADGQRISSVRGFKKTGATLALELDPDKLPVVHRVCWMALDMGVATIAATLNGEGVPTLNNRKRQRNADLWDKGSLLKMLRGRQLIGEQEVARYVEGKRKVTPGEYEQAYPAAIDQGLWDRIQVAIDSRQSGPRTGRNVTKMTNVFGDIARCECGERMKIHRRGDHGEYVYLGCSAAYVGGCDNHRFYRVDKIERALLPRLGEAVPEPTQDDGADRLRQRIVKAKAEVTRIETAYERAMGRSGELAERTAAKLESEHREKQAEVLKLERELTVMTATLPTDELRGAIRGVLDRALAGEVAARKTVADALPALVKAINFYADGGLRIELQGRQPKAMSLKLA